MGFDTRVRQAVDIIYVKRDFAAGQEAFQMLWKAAEEGDGDACLLLARCYGGSCFVDERFQYEVNDELRDEYFNRSIELGSAAGMLCASRLGGFTPRCGCLIHDPYKSPREVWDAVVKLALEGELFCELLIANAYYYGDALFYMDLDEGITYEEKRAILGKMTIAARDMYEDLYSKGMMMAPYNYRNIVTSGDYNVPKSNARNEWLTEMCQEHNIDL